MKTTQLITIFVNFERKSFKALNLGSILLRNFDVIFSVKAKKVNRSLKYENMFALINELAFWALRQKLS